MRLRARSKFPVVWKQLYLTCILYIYIYIYMYILILDIFIISIRAEGHFGRGNTESPGRQIWLMRFFHRSLNLMFPFIYSLLLWCDVPKVAVQYPKAENTPEPLKSMCPPIMFSGYDFMIGWTTCQFILQKLWLVGVVLNTMHVYGLGLQLTIILIID